MNHEVLSFALKYLEMGWRVFPLHHPVFRDEEVICSCNNADPEHKPGKHPVGSLTPRGHLDATADPAVAQRWFADTPWNIGMATGSASGFVVIDVDPEHGGVESLVALEAEHGALPPTWRFLTGGGGQHILFRHPGGTVPNSAGKVASGIDVRGDGGYIVAPPSLHMSGRRYEISAAHHPDNVPLAEMPEWLLRLTQADPRRPAGKRVEERRSVARTVVAEGRRNQTIAELSGLLLARNRSVGPHDCLELMLSFNTTHCRPPLSEQEVATTLANIVCRELRQRAGAKVQSHG